LDKNKVPTPGELMELSNKGKEEFKARVLKGTTFREIISNIEESAIEGYTGWRQKIYSDSDFRELGVIRDYLIENGYSCEIKRDKKVGAWGLVYYENYFRVNWDNKK
jgi:hypothetical protein